MAQYNPALIVLNGVLADEIGEKAQVFIRERLGLEELPPIFQFLIQRGPHCNPAEVATAYSAALSKRAAAAAESLLLSTIDSSRIETFVVTPLESESFRVAAETSEIIKRCALSTVSGGRNAIFLVPRQLLSLDERLQREAADDLELAMSSNVFPFSRCFFIDEVNELGQTVTLQEDLVDLVASFIALTIASELSDVLKNNPPPYDGAIGMHHRAYGSFSCHRLKFEKAGLVSGLSRHLARDILQHLFSNQEQTLEFRGLLKRGVEWFRLNRQLVEKELEGLDNAGADTVSRTAVEEDEIVTAARKAAEQRLDEFTDDICRQVGFNFFALRAFFDQCLGLWLAESERVADDIKAKKAELAQLSVEELLGLTRMESYDVNVIPRRKWWHVFGFGKRQVENVTLTRPVSAAQTVSRALRSYARLDKVLEIAIELFTRLDMACLRLDLLEESLAATAQSDSHSIFDLDVVDDDLIEKFYLSTNYQNREEDIKAFVRSEEFRRFKAALFTYPDRNPWRHLLEYCEHRFDFVSSYDVEKICEMKRSFNEHKEFLYLSTPFWNPLSSATGERLAIVCSDERNGFKFSRLLDSRNSPTTELHVNSKSRDHITVVQITYGLKLQDVLFPFTHATAHDEDANGTA